MLVLIAEDETIARKILYKRLENWGLPIIQAENGVEALEALQRRPDISLLITDWMMPEMDGLELCRRARAMKRNTYLHIIMLTAKNAKEDLLLGMEAGADTFLSKPFNEGELHAQIRVAERLLKMEKTLADHLAELSAAHRRIQEDLEAAASVQSSLLPSESIHFPGHEVAWVFQSCEAVAGDMMNIFRLDEDHTGFYILDVTGHGVQAALLSVSVAQTLNPLLHEGGLLKRREDNEQGYRIVPPNEVARSLNKRYPLFDQSNRFFTFLYGVLHLKTHHLQLVRAGHTPPLKISKEGEVEILDQAGSPPIGIMDNMDFPLVEYQLEAGDQIFLLSDGVEEARNPEKEEFGIDRVIQFFSEHQKEALKTMLHKLKKEVIRFTQKSTQEDDITILGIRIQEGLQSLIQGE
jgi:phosphoserine phosphatase RsbU/P